MFQDKNRKRRRISKKAFKNMICYPPVKSFQLQLIYALIMDIKRKLLIFKKTRWFFSLLI